MKIVYVYQYFSIPSGVTGNRAYELIRFLLAQGHEVTVVTGSVTFSGVSASQRRLPIQRRSLAGVDVIECGVHYDPQFGKLERARSFVRFAALSSLVTATVDADVVFATSTPLTVGVPALVARWLRGRPFVFEMRDPWPKFLVALGALEPGPLVRALEAFERAVLRGAERVVVLAPGSVQHVIERGVLPQRVVFAPNAADLDRFSPRPPDGPRTRLAFAGPTDLVLIYAGTHGLANGLDYVIDLAQAVAARTSDPIWFVLVGAGREKERLQSAARAANLTHVRFLDPIPRTELGDVFGEADLGLQVLADVPAFRYETSPNKFFDYLAAGLPVWCSYPGWVSDLITEHACGWVGGDVDVDAQRLIEIAADRPELARRGARARRLAEDEFPRRETNRRVLEALEQVGVRCEVCDGRRWRALFDLPESDRQASFRQCRGCGLVRVESERAGRDVQDHGEPDLALWTHTLDRIERARPERGALIEVGCGLGASLGVAQARGWRTLGYDLDPRYPALARERHDVEVRCEDFLTATLDPVDVIVMHQRIERVPDPVVWLEASRRALRSGGLLVLTTPNWLAASKMVAVARALGRAAPRIDPIQPERNLRLYQPRTLRLLAERNGWRVRAIGANPTHLLRPAGGRPLARRLGEGIVAGLARATRGRIEWAPDLLAMFERP